MLILYIAAAVKSWSSEAYNHYTVTMRRNYADGQEMEAKSIDFIFTCKTHPELHGEPKVRAREKSSQGTTFLLKDIANCDKKRGIEHPKPSSNVPPFTNERFRASIALRCAKSARPINMVLDEDYRDEVEMLRPGTRVPHPTTVQQDLINIYTHMAMHVVNFLAVSRNYILFVYV